MRATVWCTKHRHEIEPRLAINHDAKRLVVPAAEAFLTLPVSHESKLPQEVGDLIAKAMIVHGPDRGDGLLGLESLVIASDIVKLRHAETS